MGFQPWALDFRVNLACGESSGFPVFNVLNRITFDLLLRGLSQESLG